MTGAIIAGLIAGYGVAIPIGGVGALLVSLSARTSFRLGATAALGVATADLLYAVVAVLGGAALAGVVTPVQTPLRYTAALALVAIAVRTVWTAIRRHRNPAVAAPGAVLSSPGRAYLGLLGLTVLNPATIVYFAAFVLGNRLHLGGFDEAAFAGAVFAASSSWQLLLAGGGAVVGRLLTGPRGRLITALVSGAVVACLAVKVLVSP